MTEPQPNVIKSLSRGLTALELVLEQSATPQSLAKALDVDRTTAWRILNTLAAHGFVLRDAFDDQYVVSARKIFSFAHAISGTMTTPPSPKPSIGMDMAVERRRRNQLFNAVFAGSHDPKPAPRLTTTKAK